MATQLPPTDTPRRSGLGSFFLITALAFAAGIAVTVALVRYYSGWIMPARTASGEAAAPGMAIGGFTPPPEADSAPKTPDALALDARITALAARLGAIEGRALNIERDSDLAAAKAGRADALLIVAATRRASDRGQSLGYLDGQLRARFGRSQPRAVAAILAAASEPVTIEDLRLSLDSIAPELANGGTGSGWWPSFQRELSGLIVIHKEATPSPRPADRLIRVRRLLDARQVDAALAEVERLPGASRATAWRDAATRFVEAHRALDLLEASAIMGPQADPSSVMPEAKSAADAPADKKQTAAKTEPTATASLP